MEYAALMHTSYTFGTQYVTGTRPNYVIESADSVRVSLHMVAIPGSMCFGKTVARRSGRRNYKSKAALGKKTAARVRVVEQATNNSTSRHKETPLVTEESYLTEVVQLVSSVHGFVSA